MEFGMATKTILVVDDEELVRWSLKQRLSEEGYRIIEAPSASEARSLFEEIPDLVLLDVKLPDGNGVDLLGEFKKKDPDIPVILITAHGTVENAVLAMRTGAYDYISKPFSMDEILLNVKRALEASSLRQELKRLRRENKRKFGIENIIGKSRAISELKGMIKRIASSHSGTILLRGESGVGKGLVAQALHFESPRAPFPFMNITCTALSETLLESELFGHEKGAFTDARLAKKGLLEVADKGTVFLDEIGDLPHSIQGKLLRFLEDKTFRKVGGIQDIEVDVRIIAATNKNLEEKVRQGKFREDLYYRLNVIPLHIPPLRERPEDITVLAEEFVKEFGKEFKKSGISLSRETLDVLKAYHWPGNVRELRNALERAILLGQGDIIFPTDLPAGIANTVPPKREEKRKKTFILPEEGISLEAIEKDLLLQALEKTRWNITKAGKLLGLNRDQVRYRMEKYSLSKKPKAMGKDGESPGDKGNQEKRAE